MTDIVDIKKPTISNSLTNPLVKEAVFIFSSFGSSSVLKGSNAVLGVSFGVLNIN